MMRFIFCKNTNVFLPNINIFGILFYILIETIRTLTLTIDIDLLPSAAIGHLLLAISILESPSTCLPFYFSTVYIGIDLLGIPSLRLYSMVTSWQLLCAVKSGA